MRQPVGSLKSIGYDLRCYLSQYVVPYIPSLRLRRFLYRNYVGISIKNDSYFALGVVFLSFGNCSIGKNVAINHDCTLDNRGGLFIGDNVSLSRGVCVLTADHDVSSSTLKSRVSSVCIGDDVFVGARATILKGVTIGKGAAVAACSCVTKDVPPYTVVAGIPAKPIGSRPHIVDYQVNYSRHFH